MGEAGDPRRLHQARVRALPVAALTRKLMKKAMSWRLSETTAEDLVSRAFVRLVTRGEADWDHEKHPSAWVYLIQAMEDEWAIDKKRRKRRRTDLDTEAVEESPPSSNKSAEASAMDREGAAWARDRLLVGLEGSPLALSIVRLCIEEGEMTPAELAERLGEKVTRIYEAQRRIQEEIDRVLRASRLREARGDGTR